MSKSKKTKKKKLKKKVRIILGIIAAFFVVGIVTILAIFFPQLIPHKRSFIYEDNLTQTVVKVNDMEVHLGEMSYYIATTENVVQQMAIRYNPDNPRQFWNAHFSAGIDSKFTSDYAKAMAGDICVYYRIMQMEARENKFHLDKETAEGIKGQAEDFYTHLPHEKRDSIGLTLERIERVIERQELVQAYVEKVAKDKEMDPTLLRYDGSYYLEEILPKYVVEYNSDIWDYVRLGNMTVNLD